MSINKVTLVGNVGQDPKTTTFQNGGSKVAFSLATTEGGYKTKDGKEIKERTDWHNIIAMQSGLVKLCGYIGKGDKVAVSGRIHYSTYTDKSGVDHRVTEIVADEIEICKRNEKKAANDNDGDLPWE